MRFFIAPDGQDEPTLWVTWVTPYATITEPVVQRCKISEGIRGKVWEELLHILTVAPTMESAKATIDCLSDENAALLRANEDVSREARGLAGEVSTLRAALTAAVLAVETRAEVPEATLARWRVLAS